MMLLAEMLCFALAINICLLPIVVVCYIMESHRYAIAALREKRLLLSDMRPHNKEASEDLLQLADTVLHDHE